jgi:putative oxygen-independent coproporphyrinogen III oxidase
MPYRPPPADPAPADGALPDAALASLGARPFGVYVHVPFCATRCGYCDFNTYTAGEASRAGFVEAVIAELDIAARVVGPQQADTVFFGGGTPTLLPAGDLARILRAIEERFGAAAEITTEANPESVDPASLAALREAGFTRISLGMQSAAPHVLATLDRTHTPGRAGAAATEARAAGFEHVSLDLIYGTPGESQEDWRASLEAALAARPDHVSAYALIVEPGTRLHAQVARGALPTPDDDAMADRYELADELLGGAGLTWYELSNWAVTPAAQCHHNLGYWRSADWWGVGPGAHSHAGGVRWWNLLHPSAYTQALSEGRSPAAGRELLDAETQRFERIMLELRLADGLDLALVERASAQRLAADGLLALHGDRAVLTLEGRLKADAVTRLLTSSPAGARHRRSR